MESSKALPAEDSFSEFASPQRSAPADIARQRQALQKHYASVKDCFDAVCEIILIVNDRRQIVFFNKQVPQLLGLSPESIYGLRPGEALNCMHACKNPGGCGTSRFCSECGAVNAILNSLSAQNDLRECRIQQGQGTAFDLLVKTTPLAVDGETFCIVAITDVSHEKRRRMLERIFFHDIMNTAAGIQMLVNSFRDANQPGLAELKQHLVTASKQLMEEIKSQKELLAAESNELRPVLSQVSACQVMEDTVIRFEKLFHQANVHLSYVHPLETVCFRTDPTLLKRVLSNMVKNALEASACGQTVTLSFRTIDRFVQFEVHNPAYIEPRIQLQLFHRSFSTKGHGRGLGTYSMKLLSERCLGGRVDFESTPERGTMFRVTCPL